jgi:hypothetical protein
VISHPFTGTAGGLALPPQVCLVVSLRTNLRGRSYRGRVYQGPWTASNNVAPGVPAAAAVLDVQEQWQAHLAALAGSGVSLVVASYLHATATDVAAVSVDSRWDTQRRRLV